MTIQHTSKLICDRCGISKEYDPKMDDINWGTGIMLEGALHNSKHKIDLYYDISQARYNLCSDCCKSFWDWWDSFKRVSKC